jgi:uncharacterized protein (UPF0332 family)
MSIAIDLSNYRLELAEECLLVAKNNVEIGKYRSAANRIYYCVYNSMRSILALERKDFKSHSGVISYFREKYIKTGIFEVKLSDIIKNLFKLRNNTDYADFIVITKEEIDEQVENAEYFLNKIKEYLGK